MSSAGTRTKTLTEEGCGEGVVALRIKKKVWGEAKTYINA